jgi:membrane protein DedA with SNARE-associated domain
MFLNASLTIKSPGVTLMIGLLIQKFGYLALFLGTIVEGETILVAAGFAAHRGLLDLPLVWIVAFIGSIAGDQMFFLIGRYRGKIFLEKRPAWKSRLDRVNQYIDRYQNRLLLTFRFFYGMRTITPFALGLTDIKLSRFLILNSIGGIIWATIVGTLGYFFGSALAKIIVDIKHIEMQILAGILLGGFIIWLLRIYFRRRQTRR